MKRSGGFSKPNCLYVKYALEGQFFERMRKRTLAGAESNTNDSQVSVSDRGSISAPNKVMNHSNSNNSYGVMKRKPRGRYANVFLSDAEMEELHLEFPETAERFIEELSEYVASTGKAYVNFAAAIRRWAANDKKAIHDDAFEDYECREEDSL